MGNSAFHFDGIDQTMENQVSEVQKVIQNPWLPIIAVAVFGLSVLTYSLGSINLRERSSVVKPAARSQSQNLKMSDLKRLNQLFSLQSGQSKFYELAEPIYPSTPPFPLERKDSHETQ